MKQQSFEQRHQATWLTLETVLASKDLKTEAVELPDLYQEVCYHLAVAKNRRYTRDLINRLNGIVTDCHHKIYNRNTRHSGQLTEFIAFGFPRILRKNKKYVAVSAALFLIPFVVMWLACFFNEDIVYSVMSPAEVANFESMYQPDNKTFGRERASDTDIQMFGFYIQNNIGIAFQCFAGGVLVGLGSAFVLLFNGLMIGAAAGHITQVGYLETFYPFVIGHGAFELTAIVFSGAAGLRLGISIIAPGAYTRARSLKLASKDAVQIMYGSALMLLIAAFLEAFWSSSSTLTPAVKYTVGTVFWILVFSYCVFSGRRLS